MRRTVVPAILVMILLLPWRSEAQPRKRSRPTFFTATAYCRKGVTASGERASSGIVAADPRIIPLGSVVQVDGAGLRSRATYTVQDAGVKGRRIDIFMPNCRAARRFGKHRVRVHVVRRGSAVEERR
jgi:3D (Asp-Asp-Asp) domain-containing protein